MLYLIICEMVVKNKGINDFISSLEIFESFIFLFFCWRLIILRIVAFFLRRMEYYLYLELFDLVLGFEN